jgi:hypothetical protein
MGLNNLLQYLDDSIETYLRSKGTYPSKIIMEERTYKKYTEEIAEYVEEHDGGWANRPANYKGISISIDAIEFIKLE